MSSINLEPIALIGMGCRFPGGADTPAQFWHLLQSGADILAEIPAERWDVAAYYDPTPLVAGKMYVRHGYFLQAVDQFDPHFFQMTLREAESLDPQQRLLLEVSWEALEHAGMNPQQLRGSQTGVFAGFYWDDYSAERLYATDPTTINRYQILTNNRGLVAGRIAHALDLHGPVMPVDTSCSSSLLAIHLACQSLRLQECNLALAGGVSLALSPQLLIGVCQMQALAPDGRSKTFAADADGFGFGEGCGMVVLKRLSDALRDGDSICAVIRGSAVNHDGHSRTVTTPNGNAQGAVIQQALAAAKVEPAQIDYIEAHGTGTNLGDPIEVRTLAKIFAANRSTPLWLGSVKGNIGHSNAAAGVAGVIKVVLAMQHGEIPPHLHMALPNPRIPWAELPFIVPTQGTAWPAGTEAGAKTRMAGISSFGMSGTNVHLILAEAPYHAAPRPTAPTATPHLLTLTAQTQPALRALAARYAAAFATAFVTEPTHAFADTCYTTQQGRAHFDYRLALPAHSHQQAHQALSTWLAGVPGSAVHSGEVSHRHRPKLAFLFSGQGTQALNMGRDLYKTQPTFRTHLQQCDQILTSLWQEAGLWRRADQVAGAQPSLLSILYPDGDANQTPEPNGSALIHATQYTQPALFALEYALAMLWQAWGIQPDLLLGHSLGEIVAACVAGVFSLEDALTLVAARARLMGALPAGGKMVAVFAAEAYLQALLEPYPHQVAIAAVNGPRHVVIAGEQQTIDQLVASLTVADIQSRPLTVSHAFHSPLMQPLLAEFQQVVATLRYHKPALPIVSNLSGRIAGAEMATPDYWVNHVRQTVRFADGVATLVAQGVGIFVEIGPKPTLVGMAQQCIDMETRSAEEQETNSPALPISPAPCLFLPSLRPDQPDLHQMLTSLAQLYGQGRPIVWAQVNLDGRHKVVLPTYPFQRQRCWVEHKTFASPVSTPITTKSADPPRTSWPHTSWIDKMIRLPLHQETLFESDWSLARRPFFADHRVLGQLVAPGACQLVMVLQAGTMLFAAQQVQVEEVVFARPLLIPEQNTASGARTVQLILTAPITPAAGQKRAFQLISFAAQPESAQYKSILDEGKEGEPVEAITHLTGYVATLDPTTPLATVAPTADLHDLRQQCQQPIAVAGYYRAAANQQIELGPAFRWITGLWAAPAVTDPLQPGVARRALLGHLTQPAGVANDQPPTQQGQLLQPGLLDACLQMVGAAQSLVGTGETLLPFAIERLTLYRAVQGEQWWCYATQVDTHRWRLQLLDSNGQLIAAIDGYQLRPAAGNAKQTQPPTTNQWQDWLYTLVWQPRPRYGLPPSYLLTPAQLPASLPMMAQALWQQLAGSDEQHFLQHLEQWSVDYIVYAFYKLGFTFHPGGRWPHAQIAQQLGIIPSYHRLLTRLLAILAEAGIVAEEAGLWRVLQTPAVTLPLQPVPATARPEQALLARCGERLAEVLKGIDEPLALLFPDGNAETLRQIYGEAPSAQVMNTLIQQVVKAQVAQLPPHHGVRIIEIGAGTGSTTAALLPILPAARTEYLFTDLGSAFLQQAQTRFAEYPWLTYQPLDIEQAPTVQGLVPQQFDLVVAVNVLHATQDLSRTLNHVHQLLQPQGWLLLVEGTMPNRFIDLTSGLTSGWWRFADQRKVYPLLDAPAWETLLRANGFGAVTRVTLAETGAAQTLFLAQANPVVGIACPTPTSWLIFADQQGIGGHLAALLRQRGDTPLLVYPGADYQQVDAQTVQIRATLAEDYQRLLTMTPTVQKLVHLWSLDSLPAAVDLDARDPLLLAEQGCGTLLLMVQALLRQPQQPAALWLVTQGSQAVTVGAALPGVAQAPLWGMGKVIALEHPELHPICLDLDPTGDPASQAGALYTEITSQSWRPAAQAAMETQVALRSAPAGPQRYVARLQRLERAAAHGAARLPIRSEATYLITGGLRGLGLAVAGWLAEQGARHLVLLGRSAPQAQTATMIQALRAQGVTVTIAQADVTDYQQLQGVCNAIDRRYPLAGLIHAAGVLQDGTLVQQEWHNFQAVLAPKVQGAWHLHQLSKSLAAQGIALDCFVLFSSTASLLGSAGQANHAAANAFLDALAHYRQAQGWPALSINWGGWAEIGIAAERFRRGQLAAPRSGMGTLTTQQGLAALAALLQQARPQVGVLPIDWSVFQQQTAAHAPFYAYLLPPGHTAKNTALFTEPPTIPAMRLREQLLAATGKAQRHLLISHLQTAVAAVVGTGQAPSPHVGLTDIGVDSLLAIELRKRLETLLTLKLSTTFVFEYPTLDAMATFLLNALTAPTSKGAAITPGTPMLQSEQLSVVAEARTAPADALQPPTVDELIAQIAAKYQTIQ